MQSGLFYGYVAMVEGIVRRLHHELGNRPAPICVGTGGLAGAVAAETSVIDAVEPDLTLIGLRYVWETAGGCRGVMDAGEYCRAVESYLCRKNDGHLIRIVGPAFEMVCVWAEAGIPLSVIRRGIDQRFSRYYAGGPRRHPLRIDFCEADILTLFDDWKRAVHISGAALAAGAASSESQAPDAGAQGGGRYATPATLARRPPRSRGDRARQLDTARLWRQPGAGPGDRRRPERGRPGSRRRRHAARRGAPEPD